MFEQRALSSAVDDVRSEYAPDALVLDSERDFASLQAAQAEGLGLLVDALEPVEYPTSWLPDAVPNQLERYVREEFTIGMPEDGSVVWTRQTDPPIVIVKPRIQGSPASFVDFLLAEAFVELAADVPEHFLGFFEDEYRSFDEAVPLGPVDTYQIAAAVFGGWVGLHTREVYREWPTERPSLGETWQTAGSTVRKRIDDLPGAVARNETDFAAATELACSGIKHDISLPAPFDALDTAAYRDHGAAYAIRWAGKTFESLSEDG